VSAAAAVLTMGLLSGSCGGARENTRIFLRTDADTGEGRLFQRLRLEIFRGDAPCDGCFREVAVDARTFPSGIASFDIGGRGEVRVRARLFRVLGNVDPRPESTIDVTARVSLDSSPQVVDLPMVLVGAQRPEAAPQPVVLSARTKDPPDVLAPSLPAFRTACASPQSPGEVCIPGGRFWMGDPTMDLGNERNIDGIHERLVTVDAFLLDHAEVSVAAFRARGTVTDLEPRRHTTPGCTFAEETDPERADFDARPVNCVGYSRVVKFCADQGKDLPTEAELEYVQGALRSRRYVWGDGPPRCQDAVLLATDCEEPAPKPSGSASRDTLTLPGGASVVDLIGNVHELTRDLWNPETGPCWGPGTFYNPVCTTPDRARPTARVVRGGAYADLATFARSALREYVDRPDSNLGTSVGFRCVRRLSQ
jgi:formylglycine-generating enzyme required for sulfatase activity